MQSGSALDFWIFRFSILDIDLIFWIYCWIFVISFGNPVLTLGKLVLSRFSNSLSEMVLGTSRDAARLHISRKRSWSSTASARKKRDMGVIERHRINPNIM